MTGVANFTPHNLTIVGDEGEIVATFPSEGLARVSMTRERTGSIETKQGSVPLFKVAFGEVEGLPDPQEGTIYVVSSIVASHPSLRGREDVFVPGDLVRDDQGRVIGARGLARGG